MRRGVESLRRQDLLNFDGLYKIALADAETRAGDRVRAIAILDEALATADRLGYRAFEAELNRTRGEILLECDPASPAPAEGFPGGYRRRQVAATRSFELRAALSLASSTNRPVAPLTPTPCLRRRWRAFRRRPKCRRSPRGMRCWRRSRRRTWSWPKPCGGSD